MDKNTKIPSDAVDTILDVIGRLDAIYLLLGNSAEMAGHIPYLADVIYHLLDPLRELVAKPSDGKEEA